VRLAWSGGGAPPPPPARLTLEARIPAARSSSAGRLIHGDNLPVMGALVAELEGRIDLIYLDPPFQSGKQFHTRVGTNEDSRRPDTWKVEAGYDDRWPDTATYLDMLRPRLELVHRLLARSGTLYIHLDWHISAYVRVLLDEIFGAGRLLNEIVWAYHGPSPIRTAFSRKHDTILSYSKSKEFTFNADAVRIPYDPATVKAFASSPKAGFGKVPNLKRGKVPEDWWTLPVVARLHNERTGYPTQKPLALVQRIVRASSRPDDLVADFFCGSGTALVAAARERRRWIGCDDSGLACATTYRRLMLECPGTGVEWFSAAHADVLPLDPYLRATGRDDKATVRLSGRKRMQWIEVDWDYDGRRFDSQARAARPWRSSDPLPQLEHRYRSDRQHRVAARAADDKGMIYFAERTLSL
jgi:DNA modification methylase